MDKADVANEGDLDQSNIVIESETEDASDDDVETASENIIDDFCGDDETETESTSLIRRHCRRGWGRFQQ
jgi:hypothetical protein